MSSITGGETAAEEAPEQPRDPTGALGDVPDGTADDAPDVLLEGGRAARHQKKGFWGALKELPVLILLALGLALIIKTFLVQAFFIPSPSMVPTLEVGDRVLVNKLAYRLGEPARGDVVVFLNPNRTEEPSRDPVSGFINWLGHGLGIGQPEDEDFIKRVIGLPGETVRVSNKGVWVDGQQLDEPYIAENGGENGTWEVPADHVFVMGDNRPNSSDSRVFEAIPIDSIVGKAFVRIWPVRRWDGL